ncbi:MULTISPECIES: reverse transcriptase domain-containing protein [unclassified Brenneria]|uniref:Group II intron reverse transcriptase/maturase n=2 Tax=Affinibrenneria salicis TaxID=2590031 RepID=A0A5J5FSG3_9GAMM|nr:reverse transcriptase domain-containing protein [Brenneria sp. L3-3C-1]KAA8995885.1 group II intron reverse transcriptase/maturase [Affinibrenneria salicis]MBJ7223193.1 group II intron reverse transcriptase/maturase [Brenneria sp. L3-3C-1]MEE3644435.1 reverse transcriptase domain-containing protein [Brenneria sp. L3_3C_1]
MQQKTHCAPIAEGRGEAPEGRCQGAETVQAPTNGESPPSTAWLMEAICEPVNLRQALKRVKANKGAAGVDGMSASELPDYLKHHWLELKAQLLSGSYRPSPVRRVSIPKPGGGERLLGIPAVVDRFVQQATMQVLQRQWDSMFSEHSYGFLKAGVMEAGLVMPMTEGTPQGGLLSPLLSNLLLDDFDRELEKRGLKFARYADDCNIYVKSERAGNRVMAGLTRWLSRKLKLKVNAKKSAVARPDTRKFLGYSFRTGRKVWCVVSPESVKRFKTRVRALTGRNTGRSLEQLIRPLKRYLTGWKSYYGLNQWPSLMRPLNMWIRSRLRCVLWKQWKTSRRRFEELRVRGIGKELAVQTVGSCHSLWRISCSPGLNMALPNSLFLKLGLPEL